MKQAVIMRKKKYLNLWYQALLKTLNGNEEEIAMTKSSDNVYGSVARTADSAVDDMMRTGPYPGSNIDN